MTTLSESIAYKMSWLTPSGNYRGRVGTSKMYLLFGPSSKEKSLCALKKKGCNFAWFNFIGTLIF